MFPRAFFPLFLSGLLLWAGNVGAEGSYTGRVIRVPDGNHLVILSEAGSQYQVGLLGIRAPDASSRQGTAVKRRLESLLMGRFVVAELALPSRGRPLATIRYGGADVNLRLLSDGLAQHDPRYQPPAMQRLYAEAERAAQQAKRGFWAEADRRR